FCAIYKIRSNSRRFTLSRNLDVNSLAAKFGSHHIHRGYGTGGGRYPIFPLPDVLPLGSFL
ncbi:MAG TPA: hypothetical protein PL193_05175, partial [Xanthobacteraceae bacterium]|nr:hypothetical protein [Xanthobacteraceae bacterium]